MENEKTCFMLLNHKHHRASETQITVSTTCRPTLLKKRDLVRENFSSRLFDCSNCRIAHNHGQTFAKITCIRYNSNSYSWIFYNFVYLKVQNTLMRTPTRHVRRFPCCKGQIVVVTRKPVREPALVIAYALPCLGNDQIVGLITNMKSPF